MKKIVFLTIASIVLNAGLLIYCFAIKKPTQTVKKDAKTFNIALFEPASHPALDEIMQGFMDTLQAQGKANYTFKRYNANGNKTLMRSQAEEMVHGNFDLIFTIGAGCTAIIADLSRKKEVTTPLVFSAVDDPVGMHLIASLASSGNHLTGVIENPDYVPQINLLKTIKPGTKNMLLVYDPTHGTGLEKDKQELTKLCAQQGITLQAVEVFNAGEIQQKVEGKLKDVDTVLVLKDNTIVSAIDGLVRLCNRYGVTLYASDLNSGQKGAALAYGVTEKEFGIGGAHKALEILDGGKQPTNIPVTPIANYRFAINSKTAEQQKVPVTADMLALMKIVTVV